MGKGKVVQLCENGVFRAGKPYVRCYGRMTVIKNAGTVYESHLCADCAYNGEERLRKRALAKWAKLEAVLHGKG